MSTSPPGTESSSQFYRTVVAHFEGPDGEPPPGVRVVEPAMDTRQALRGNLYAIVDVVGENPERVQLAERLLSAIQRTYFTRGGSQSEVLTEAVRQARLRANEFNQGHPDQPIQLGVICVGLVQSRLMIAHSGPGVALITVDKQVERYPQELQTFAAETKPATPVSVEIYRQDVGARTAFFVGTTRWLDMVNPRTIAGAVAHLTVQNCAIAASGLLAESQQPDLPGLLVVIERTDAPPPRSVARTPLSTAPSRAASSAATAGLPVSVTAQAVLSHDAPQPDAQAPNAGELHASDDLSSEMPIAAVHDRSSDPSSHHGRGASAGVDSRTNEADDRSAAQQDRERHDSASATDAWPDAEPGEMRARQTQFDRPNLDVAPAASRHARESSRWKRSMAGIAAAMTAITSRTVEIARGMVPDRSAATSAEYAAQAADDAWAADMGTSMPDGEPDPTFYDDVSARVNAALAETAAPFTPPEPASGGRARLFITLAVLILLLVPIVVFAVYQQRGQDPAISGENHLQIAETYLANAWTALDNGDESSAREMFLKTQESLGDAVALLGENQRTEQIAAEVDLGLAEVMQTRYLYQLIDPLLTFGLDAEPSRVLVAGEHIFVMDRGRQVIEHYETDPLREFVPNAEPEIIMREGQRVGEAVIAAPVDMAWQPIIAGYEERPKLLMLDRNRQIFSYDVRVDGVQAVPLGVPSILENPTQIETFATRTYIADEGANQIQRYNPGGFSGSPEPWFPSEIQPYMSGLLAMAIDGDIWLLNSEGTLVRYNSGEQVPFSLDQGAVRADEPVDMALGGLADGLIYIADAAHDRILVFDKQGLYRYQLLAAEGEPLHELRGLFLDEVDSKIYILTKSALYQHPLPE